MTKHYWLLIIIAVIISSALAETPKFFPRQDNTNFFYIVLGRVKEIKSVASESPPPKIIDENEKGGVIRLYPSFIMKLITFSKYRAFFVTNGIAYEIATMKYPVTLLMDRNLSITNDLKILSLFYARKYNPPVPFSIGNRPDGKLILTVSSEHGLCVQEGSVKFDSALRQYKIILPTNQPPPESNPTR